jgi:rare lipoprotein A (peptidoglycan hydrolase)
MERINTKKIVLISSGITIALMLIYELSMFTLTNINSFFEKNRIVRQKVIDIKLNLPIRIEKRIIPKHRSSQGVKNKTQVLNSGVVLATKRNPTGTQSEYGIRQEGNVWYGKVSHYSRAGCIGCDPNFIMANGQPLDDNAFTIAFNHAKMNSRARVTNLDNGKSVIVDVTDTGGFEQYDRIADLTIAVGNAIGTKSNNHNLPATKENGSNISVEIIN